jgi:hypothetical protein
MARSLITQGQDSFALARFYSSGGVGLCGTALTNERQLPCMWVIGGMIIDGEVEVLREILVVLAYCQRNFLLGLA